MEAHIPYLKGILINGENSRTHWEGKEPYIQAITISEPYSLPGIAKDSTVLIVAGNTGEVYRKLIARKIIFTELVPKRLEVAKGRWPDNSLQKVEFKLADANFLNLKNDCADVALSFEPYNLIKETPYFFLNLIRCAREEIIILRRDLAIGLEILKNPDIELKEIAHTYKMPVKVERIRVNGRVNAKQFMPTDIREIELVANVLVVHKDAKKYAALDLKIIEAANEAQKNKTITKNGLEAIRQRFGLKKRAFEEALKRISALAGNDERTEIKGIY